jgi:hypothetical protein
MKVSGSALGAAVFVGAYALAWAAYLARIFKRYREDRGIRFGSTTLVLFLCMLAISRLPDLGGVTSWVLPYLFFPALALGLLSLYFIVVDTVIDIRKLRNKRDKT